MSRKHPYRLPNNEWTDNALEYVEAWHALMQPIMDFTDTVMHAYGGRGVSLKSKDGQYRSLHAELPVWFLQAFNKAMEEYNDSDTHQP